jgi:hypothetical protein
MAVPHPPRPEYPLSVGGEHARPTRRSVCVRSTPDPHAARHPGVSPASTVGRPVHLLITLPVRRHRTWPNVRSRGRVVG